jgi:hypothetical protein
MPRFGIRARYKVLKSCEGVGFCYTAGVWFVESAPCFAKSNWRDYSDDEAPAASDASETLGHFAVFRGRVFKRITTNCLLQGIFVSLVLAPFGVLLIDLKI